MSDMESVSWMHISRSAGLRAVRSLAEEGIRTNVTLCFSANQALLAAKAGAAYISPFVGRLDDVGEDGMDLIGSIVSIYSNYEFDTEVLVASVRGPLHVMQSALLGAVMKHFQLQHRFKTILLSSILSASLLCGGSAFAASFDFAARADNFGGLPNGTGESAWNAVTLYSWTVDGITVTATARNLANTKERYVYADAKNAGLGVCTKLKKGSSLSLHICKQPPPVSLKTIDFSWC